MMQAQEFLISNDEAKTLATAIAKVQALYGGTIDPRVAAWVELGVVAGALYVPRVIMFRQRKTIEKLSPEEQQAHYEAMAATANR